jgi:hypothetical protein
MTNPEDVKTIKFLRKRITDLCKDGNELYNKMLFRETKGLFFYPKEKLRDGFRIDDLYERTIAAQTLGWNVIMEADDKGLHFSYAKKLPGSRPSSF